MRHRIACHACRVGQSYGRKLTFDWRRKSSSAMTRPMTAQPCGQRRGACSPKSIRQLRGDRYARRRSTHIRGLADLPNRRHGRMGLSDRRCRNTKLLYVPRSTHTHGFIDAVDGQDWPPTSPAKNATTASLSPRTPVADSLPTARTVSVTHLSISKPTPRSARSRQPTTPMVLFMIPPAARCWSSAATPES